MLCVVEESEKRPLLAVENTEDRIIWKDWLFISRTLQMPETNIALKVISSEENSHVIAATVSKDDVPNRHLEYIITWYTLAGLSILMSRLFKNKQSFIKKL